MNPREIDLNKHIFGCAHIKWKEVLWLNSYRMYAHPPSDQIISNLIQVGKLFDKVRKILGDKPMRITSGYRPDSYNEKIGGAKGSAHTEGLALDFQHSVLSADEVRMELLAHLVPLNFRMEDLRGSNWVHIDLRKPIKKRFFKP